MTKIIALCNQKGGVGKTTTAFHLARAAVVEGKKVLVVDNDPQGNLTSVIAKESVLEDQAGLADVLSSRTSEKMGDVVIEGIWENLSVVPTSGATLGYVRDELVIAGAGRENRLKEALAGYGNAFDLVLIDCAPSLDQLTINGLVAAGKVLIVTQSKLFSANGLAQLLTTIENVHEYYNPELEIAGILVNQHEERTISGQTWSEELQGAARGRGIEVFSPPIPKRVFISDAAESSTGLDEWGSKESIEIAKIYSSYLQTIEGKK